MASLKEPGLTSRDQMDVFTGPVTVTPHHDDLPHELDCCSQSRFALLGMR